MRIRTIAAAGAAVLALALSACSGGGEPDDTASSSAAASPSADTEAAEQACKQAWRASVENGSVDNGSVSMDNPPAECEGVRRAAHMAAEALQENLDKNRACLTDPACTDVPKP